VGIVALSVVPRSEAGVQFEYRWLCHQPVAIGCGLDACDGPWLRWSEPGQLPQLSLPSAPGCSYLLEARGTDSAGNVGPVSSIPWVEPACPPLTVTLTTTRAWSSGAGLGTALAAVALEAHWLGTDSKGP
jgi:hypothetical protein